MTKKIFLEALNQKLEREREREKIKIFGENRMQLIYCCLRFPISANGKLISCYI